MSDCSHRPRESRISRTSAHSGAIKALQFNPHRPELLASAGAKGELYITDLNNAANPFRLGQATARPEDFDALDWNKQVAHIMATGGSNGFVTVWDVKAKKESLTLNNYGRKTVSAVAWNPDLPTKLATAVPSDQDPLILMWDLRNSSAPERILRGHDQGVLSLSWCQHDSGLLLSCGKDNRSICWNPHTGEPVGEFPIVTNWTFQTRWNPRQPHFLATASFDGKIAVETIQNTNSDQEKAAQTTTSAADGADFFAKAHAAPSGSSFSLAKPPKWLSCPAGAKFGFGGKLVTFKPTEDGKSSKINIATFASDPSVDKSISEFAEALKGDDLEKTCNDKIEAAGDEKDRNDWKVIQSLVSQNPRKGLLAYLGFSDDDAKPADDQKGEEKPMPGSQESDGQVNGFAETKPNRLSSFFDTGSDGDGFLADLAASKGAKTNRPFSIFTGSESAADKKMTRALMLGSFEDALDICLQENRMSDAFMIAICGGQECIDKAQAAYFAQQSHGPNYLRLLASIVGKNLWDIVYNAELDNWAEVMATLCTFADETEFPDLCEALGDRLEEVKSSHKDASFCYLAGSKLDKVIPIWLNEMAEVEKTRSEAAEDESAFSLHVQALQFFIEKVSIFRQATAYVDKDGQEKSSDWRLELLYAKYAEYADVVASYGHLDLAEQYLGLLPSTYATAEVARNRVRQATRKAPAQQKVAATGRPMPNLTAPTNPGYSTQAPMPAASPVAPSSRSAYAPPAPQQGYQPAQSTYAPAGAFANNYEPSGPQQPPPQAPSNAGPPSSGPPPPRGATNGTNWNDLPDTFQRRTPVPRTGTPSLGGPSPYGGNPNAPPTMNNLPPQRAASPLPPPPKSGAPPSVTSPSTDHSSARPSSSSAANTYAPPPPQTTSNYAPTASMPPRGQSPYNAPPAAAPPSNRYAPAPGSQLSGAAPAPYGAPPPRQAGAPPSAYTPQPPPQSQPQYGPLSQQMPMRPPSQGGPPPVSKPPIAPPPKAGPPPRSGPPPSSRTATPSISKHRKST